MRIRPGASLRFPHVESWRGRIVVLQLTNSGNEIFGNSSHKRTQWASTVRCIYTRIVLTRGSKSRTPRVHQRQRRYLSSSTTHGSATAEPKSSSVAKMLHFYCVVNSFCVIVISAPGPYPASLACYTEYGL
ncbi:Uncharacterized protein HZ326_30814 [Fusarium oxysporum f. sp. albedinis]|nr:Uncharacterized protein HZ326_30814 [Fusarium oxysporum f. sp. albedinis]